MNNIVYHNISNHTLPHYITQNIVIVLCCDKTLIFLVNKLVHLVSDHTLIATHIHTNQLDSGRCDNFTIKTADCTNTVTVHSHTHIL